MNISFQWHGDKITTEQIKKVESDIRVEIPESARMLHLPNHDSLVVYLFQNPFMSLLEGSATTEAGEIVFKITYSLTHPCNRRYFVPAAAHSDAQ